MKLTLTHEQRVALRPHVARMKAADAEQKAATEDLGIALKAVTGGTLPEGSYAFDQDAMTIDTLEAPANG